MSTGRGKEGVVEQGRDKVRLFEQQALPHMDALYGTGLRLTKDPREAEDLVQETFLRAYAFFDRFQQGTNCRAWLFTIMHNAFINRYRRRLREREAFELDTEGALSDNFVSNTSLTHYKSPEKQVQRSLLSDVVTQALDELPEEFRLAVVLSDLQDFSYKEIASILDCPVGTIMSRLFRGRRLLREKLFDHAMEQGVLPRSASEHAEQRIERMRSRHAG